MNKWSLMSGLISTGLLISCQTTELTILQTKTAQVESRIPDNWQTHLQQGTHPQNWIALFDDPILHRYLLRAEKNNADLSRAVLSLQQSEAGLRETRAILRPVLRTDLQISGSSPLDDFDPDENLSTGISASWDPGLFGRNAIEITQSQALLDVAQANSERVRRVVMAQVARAYIQIIEADNQLNLARENLEFIGETLRISEARFKAGDIARDGLALAQLQFANAEANVMSLELSARNLRRSLSVLIGDTPNAELEVANVLPAPAHLNTSLLPAEVLGRRFDVAASRARIASRFASLQQAERLNWPGLTLSGRVGGSGGTLGDMFDIDRYIASLTASLASTLFDGGRKTARIESAQAGLDAALVDYDEILREALQDVESGFDRITVAKRRLSSLERGSAAANKALELEKIKFDLGESIVLDVLEVQRQVNAILASNISTKRSLLDAQIDTYLALGGNL